MWRLKGRLRIRKPSTEGLLGGLMVLAALTLVVLLYFYVRPVQTVDIKVPVATDRSSYYPGEQVSGIFFGQVYYEGKVEVLREVYCKDYKATIKTDQGDDIFKGISRVTTLDGASRQIGKLPSNIPIGSNCVIQFANTYRIATPFGDRQITKVYYTQNFAIISVGRRLQLDCEAKGNKDCDKLNDANSTVDKDGNIIPAPADTNYDAQLYQPAQSQDSSTGQDSSNQAQTQTNGSTTPSNGGGTTVQNPPAQSEPVQPPGKQCSIKLLFVCL
jgi:hypothetical protein